MYYRPRLPEVISGQVLPDDIVIYKDDWYGKHNLELIKNTIAWELDPQEKVVLTKNGKSYPYDRLLLAGGAHCFVPPISGADNKNVFTLRNLEDAQDIRKRAHDAETAVLIGGGLLGLEAGFALTKLGLKVKVIEFFPRLLPRQLDENGADMLACRLSEMGFEFHCGVATKEIRTLESGALSVLAEGGFEESGDFIIISAGIRPNLEVAREAGLKTDKGVAVDEFMQTSASDVFAAGDNIELNGRMWGIWPAARDQGIVAGRNMAGKKTAYSGTLLSTKLKVAGIELASAGDIDPENKLESELVCKKDECVYQKIVKKDGKIVGAIFLGDTDRGTEIIKQIGK